MIIPFHPTKVRKHLQVVFPRYHAHSSNLDDLPRHVICSAHTHISMVGRTWLLGLLIRVRINLDGRFFAARHSALGYVVVHMCTLPWTRIFTIIHFVSMVAGGGGLGLASSASGYTLTTLSRF
jgi:hypothetical protein